MRIVVSIAVLFVALGVRGDPPPDAEPRIELSVDPRIELLAAVQALSGYERTGLITRQDFPYKREMIEHFAPHADHRAVTMFAGMSRRGFSYDAPVQAILHFGPPPELAPGARLPEAVVRRAGSARQLAVFLQALRDFAAESGFNEFYDAHEAFYDTLAEDARVHLEGIDVSMLEDYYGVKQHGYHIILAPLFHPGGFGPRVDREDEGTDLYSVVGPNGVAQERPAFGSPEDFRYLVWHEFSHSFVNPAVDAHGEEIDRFADLFEPLRASMQRQAYGNWRTCVYEHLVRAATCRFAFREDGEDAGRAAIEHERSRGFAYVEALCARLQQYEQSRDRYPTLNDFMPELIDVFREAADASR